MHGQRRGNARSYTQTRETDNGTYIQAAKRATVARAAARAATRVAEWVRRALHARRLRRRRRRPSGQHGCRCEGGAARRERRQRDGGGDGGGEGKGDGGGEGGGEGGEGRKKLRERHGGEGGGERRLRLAVTEARADKERGQSRAQSRTLRAVCSRGQSRRDWTRAGSVAPSGMEAAQHQNMCAERETTARPMHRQGTA